MPNTLLMFVVSSATWNLAARTGGQVKPLLLLLLSYKTLYRMESAQHHAQETMLLLSCIQEHGHSYYTWLRNSSRSEGVCRLACFASVQHIGRTACRIHATSTWYQVLSTKYSGTEHLVLSTSSPRSAPTIAHKVHNVICSIVYVTQEASHIHRVHCVHCTHGLP